MGAGRGVFVQRDIEAGTTLTEWVGLVAAPPASHADEMALWQARGVVVRRRLSRKDGRIGRIFRLGRAAPEGGAVRTSQRERGVLEFLEAACDCARMRRPRCASPAVSRGLRRVSPPTTPPLPARDDVRIARPRAPCARSICSPRSRVHSQEYYGANWRDYSGRYEIGVSAPIATGAAAAAFAAHHEAITAATGAEVTLGGPAALGGAVHASARESHCVPSTALVPEDCEAELGSTACSPEGEIGTPARTPVFRLEPLFTRSGSTHPLPVPRRRGGVCWAVGVTNTTLRPRALDMVPQRRGDFVIYGKPVSRGACAREGVAQLINDHSAILPDEKKEAHLASLGGARAAAQARARGLIRGGGMGSDTRLDGADAALSSVSQLSKSMREYLLRAEALNNVAMVRARGASRAQQSTTRRTRKQAHAHTHTRALTRNGARSRGRLVRSPPTALSVPTAPIYRRATRHRRAQVRRACSRLRRAIYGAARSSTFRAFVVPRSGRWQRVAPERGVSCDPRSP